MRVRIKSGTPVGGGGRRDPVLGQDGFERREGALGGGAGLGLGRAVRGGVRDDLLGGGQGGVSDDRRLGDLGDRGVVAAGGDRADLLGIGQGAALGGHQSRAGFI